VYQIFVFVYLSWTTGKLIQQADENTSWGKSKKYDMEQKAAKIQAEPNAEKTSGTPTYLPAGALSQTSSAVEK